MKTPLATILTLVTTLTFASCSAVHAKATLSKIFSDGAILQRGKPVTVFGTANVGESVTITLAGQSGTAVADKDGKFVVTLPPNTGTGSYELRVLGSQVQIIKNIRFGEVWLLAGDLSIDENQSSTTPNIDQNRKTDDEIAAGKDIKIFKVKVNFSPSPASISALKGHWENLDSDSPAQRHNQLALQFARTIKERVCCPVAIIEVEGPKAPLRSWISKEALELKADSRAVALKYALDGDNFKVLNEHFAQGKLSPELAGMTSGLFNGMIAPLSPFTMRGIIWRQGLGDMQSALNYKLLLPLLISDLRASLKQEQLPLILVQLGAVAQSNSATAEESTASLIRFYQLKARLAPKTYLVLSLDLDKLNKESGKFETDITTLSARVAAAALTTQYQKPTPYQSPVVELVEPEADGLKLTLRHVGRGIVSRDKKKITGFAVAGWDHKYVDADATLSDDSVLVTSDQVRQPKFVRYGWGNNPTLSLFNAEGLPLAPYTNDR